MKICLIYPYKTPAIILCNNYNKNNFKRSLRMCQRAHYFSRHVEEECKKNLGSTGELGQEGSNHGGDGIEGVVLGSETSRVAEKEICRPLNNLGSQRETKKKISLDAICLNFLKLGSRLKKCYIKDVLFSFLDRYILRMSKLKNMSKVVVFRQLNAGKM